jgi:thiol-disulfide isomerase/thioredoxin
MQFALALLLTAMLGSLRTDDAGTLLPIAPGTEWRYHGSLKVTQTAADAPSFAQKFELRYVALSREADGTLRFLLFQNCEPADVTTGGTPTRTKGGVGVELLTLSPDRTATTSWGEGSIDEPSAGIARMVPWPASAAPTQPGATQTLAGRLGAAGVEAYATPLVWIAADRDGLLELTGVPEKVPVPSQNISEYHLTRARSTYRIDRARRAVAGLTHESTLVVGTAPNDSTWDERVELAFDRSLPVPKAEFDALLADIGVIDTTCKSLDATLPTEQFAALLLAEGKVAERLEKTDLAPLLSRMKFLADGVRNTARRRKEESDLFATISAKPFPEITGKDEDGNDVSVDDYRGSVVLLDLWDSSCGFCLIEAPRLAELAKRHEKAGLVVVGINTGKEIEREVAFLKQSKVAHGSQILGQAALLDTLHVKGVPTHFLLDRKGELRRVFVGFNSLADMERGVAELLQEPPPGK